MRTLARSVVLIILLAGCASATGEIRREGTDPIIFVHDLEGGMEMKVGGTLTYNPSSKCLFLTHTQGGNVEMAPLIWPEGTEPLLHAGKRGVNVPGKGQILQGDQVDGAGGGIDPARLAGITPPPGCLSAEKITPIAITQFN
ncbi:hypothetical protein ACGF0J_09570 [Nonomuraea sp. NPDC047897]|uniref:hypothetical protein n=1 Tax=Nonomuraea sp. NPDC047897 TaxID=3364346 RepID=UPI00371A39B0